MVLFFTELRLILHLYALNLQYLISVCVCIFGAKLWERWFFIYTFKSSQCEFLDFLLYELPALQCNKFFQGWKRSSLDKEMIYISSWLGHSSVGEERGRADLFLTWTPKLTKAKHLMFVYYIKQNQAKRQLFWLKYVYFIISFREYVLGKKRIEKKCWM